MSDNEFDAYVKALIDEMRPGTRFIMGMGDNLTVNSDINRLRRVVDIIERYGRLPLA